MLLSKHPQRPAAGSSPAQADARQGLLHGRAPLPAQGLKEVRCQLPLHPAAMAPAVPCSPHAYLSRVWCCPLFMHSLQVSAFCLTVLRHAGAFEKSKNQEWPLNGVSDFSEMLIVQGICAFSGARQEMSKNFLARRGSASDTRERTTRMRHDVGERGVPSIITGSHAATSCKR